MNAWLENTATARATDPGTTIGAAGSSIASASTKRTREGIVTAPDAIAALRATETATEIVIAGIGTEMGRAAAAGTETRIETATASVTDGRRVVNLAVTVVIATRTGRIAVVVVTMTMAGKIYRRRAAPRHGKRHPQMVARGVGETVVTRHPRGRAVVASTLWRGPTRALRSHPQPSFVTVPTEP